MDGATTKKYLDWLRTTYSERSLRLLDLEPRDSTRRGRRPCLDD